MKIDVCMSVPPGRKKSDLDPAGQHVGNQLAWLLRQIKSTPLRLLSAPQEKSKKKARKKPPGQPGGSFVLVRPAWAHSYG
jgi:hypothetical protein